MPAISVSRSGPSTQRLYYLDWLRVIAVLGVFLFHAVHPFDFFPWHIKNAEQSMVITIFLSFLFPWGMPFFFLLAGAGSWFALRRRSAAQYAHERFNRLLVPYIVGAILLMPIMLYFEWRHNIRIGEFTMPFRDFLLNRNVGFSPRWFGALGYHLWFLGFLFSFSILCLPAFLWLKGDRGRRLIDRLAGFTAWRGALLIAIIPLVLIRLSLHPFFPKEHDWSDFFYLLTFFLLGFVLYADERFLATVRRDRRIHLGLGVAATICGFALFAYTGSVDVEAPPRSGLDVLLWVLITISSWCWTLYIVHVGMRYLDFENRYLEYGKDAIMPFFVFHQPVIIMVAYYAVQWQVNLVVKLLFVVVTSFLITLGIYEFLIRRSASLSRLFGLKVIRVARSA